MTDLDEAPREVGFVEEVAPMLGERVHTPWGGGQVVTIGPYADGCLATVWLDTDAATKWFAIQCKESPHDHS